MKQLLIDEQKARSRYKSASPEIKEILEDTFGKEFFSGEITDRIKTYEDACMEIGEQHIDENKLINPLLSIDEILLRKIKTITKALNEGWKPDWNDSSQRKWFPWFRMSSGGFVFGGADFGLSCAGAGYASRLCFKNKELAEYAGKQFTKLYSDYILYYQ
ncbi:MAG: hypothetical protein PHH37_08435 [Paludibacter sp.]|nr:hypothetical protein [Paludibacter sp.]